MINLYRSRMYCSSRACCMNCGWRNLIFSRFRQLERILITRQFVPFRIICLDISVCLIKCPRIAFNRKNYYSVLFRYIRKRLIGKVWNGMRNKWSPARRWILCCSATHSLYTCNRMKYQRQDSWKGFESFLSSVAKNGSKFKGRRRTNMLATIKQRSRNTPTPSIFLF